MDLTAWALYSLIAAALCAGAWLHYRRHEPVVPGRPVLALLRGAVLALLVLLLFTPVVPAGIGIRTPATVALVDASLSMRLPAPDGTTRWEEAERAVGALRPDRILVYGLDEARAVRSLEEAEPSAPGSRLGSALRGVLEAGASRVVVITDAAIQDPAEAERLAAASAARLELVRVGEATAGNLGVAELELPAWAQAGDEVTARVAVARLGAPVPDSVTVSLRRGGSELARARIVSPAEGRLSVAELSFAPGPSAAEPVRLDAMLEVTDAEPADDARSAYILVTDEAAGVALVSFRPDQEPRFLLPVLERALGVPARGWMSLPGGRYIRLGTGAEAGRLDDEARVRRALASADLVVVHGLDAGAPAWARSAVDAAGRVLIFPGRGASPVPFGPGAPAQGDWYVVGELPPSPIAGLLAGVDVEASPPLTSARPATPPAGGWTPLHVRLERRGEARPALVAGRIGDRRVVVATGAGYWRWAFDDGPGRRLYEALWAGVGGWLMEGSGAFAEAPVRPAERAAPRGEPLRWLVPAGADSVRITIQPLAGPGQEPAGEPAALDTVVTASAGVARTAAARPGHYRYEARAFGPEAQWTAAGPLTVERYSPEFTRPSLELVLEREGEGEGRVTARAPGRPLHATPWPWLALVAMLCIEWVLRRRWGLR